MRGAKDISPRDWSAHPAYRHAPYKSTALRSPSKPLIPLPATLSELSGPAFGHDAIGSLDHDLTSNARKDGEPIGERIIVSGRVVDEQDRPVPGALVEIWQANSCGRYAHVNDQHPAPLDPNFLGAGRCIADDDGRYEFVTLKPGAYPWGNHHNAWRPAHIHFSVFGASFAQRLVTQMYFPGDPLFEFDPIFNGVPEGARERLIADFSLDRTQPNWALGYDFDIVLRGRKATPMES